MQSGYYAVAAIDLNLANEWYESVVKRYLPGKAFEKWYISNPESMVSLNSKKEVILPPENVADFLIDSDQSDPKQA